MVYTSSSVRSTVDNSRSKDRTRTFRPNQTGERYARTHGKESGARRSIEITWYLISAPLTLEHRSPSGHVLFRNPSLRSKEIRDSLRLIIYFSIVRVAGNKFRGLFTLLIEPLQRIRSRRACFVLILIVHCSYL